MSIDLSSFIRLIIILSIQLTFLFRFLLLYNTLHSPTHIHNEDLWGIECPTASTFQRIAMPPVLYELYLHSLFFMH